MKTPIDRLPPFHHGQTCLNVIIETSKGSPLKYAYDPDSGLLQLKQSLPEGMQFPFNFGIIPSTRAEDGDPLDILVLNEAPIIAGCLLKVRPVAVIEAEQTEKKKTTRNDRLIGVTFGEQIPAELKSLELNARLLQEIEYFFITYNHLNGKKFKVLATGGPKKAQALVRKASKAFQNGGNKN